MANQSFRRVRSFWFGLTLPITSLKLIFSRPKLIFLSSLPIAISIGFYTFFISKTQTLARLQIDQAIQSWGIQMDGWFAIVVSYCAKILVFLVSAYTFSFVTNLIACPFSDFLAEATEPYATPPLPPAKVSGLTFRARLIALDMMKMITATGLSLVAVLASWIPVVNFVALLITFLLICFQFTSYPQTRRNQGVQEGIRFLWKYFFACLGMGISITFLFSIPLVSCLILPLAVVSGTLLYSKSQDRTVALK